MLLDIVLDIFFKLLAGLSTLGEDDACLNDLSSYFIWSCGNTTLKNIGKLHDDVLDLKGSDTVARGLDNVVDTSDIPEVAVLITPCDIAGVVYSVVPYLVRSFLISVIAEEDAAGSFLRGIDADLAGFTDIGFRSVGSQKLDIVERSGFAH